ncbi:flagellar basal body-associated FliL family protein [Nocardioides caldifontis]|uniref:flagellar basal body-associated FliL family protein n=1 Tax=Nocardioides caldifontis TaxID=2588938 RepID=UPI001396BFD2|nr:flagellar basal body-associated FliL family protein [Nocardioides caldifontis]
MATTQLSAQASSSTPAQAPAKGSKKKLIIVAALLVAMAGGAYWFLLRPVPEKEPVPGEVMTLEPIQVNLAEGRYLKVGVALQLTDAVAEEPDGGKALDSLIALFSGRDLEELADKESRAKLKKELQKELIEEYEGEVMAVYFTNFVTQ